jgi:hypothetical protein
MPEPPSIHYTTQKPATFNERHLAQIQVTRLQMEWFGAPPICFVPECRRAGRCRGNPQKGRFYLPPCFGHYRQEFRFMLSAPGGIKDLRRRRDASALMAVHRRPSIPSRFPSTCPRAP